MVVLGTWFWFLVVCVCGMHVMKTLKGLEKFHFNGAGEVSGEGSFGCVLAKDTNIIMLASFPQIGVFRDKTLYLCFVICCWFF